uniref:NADH-ubiquinone oxidoreductase chain 6 n=1 Tax=Chaetocnema tibialis TaxID=1425544 RepID=A0A3G1GRV7_9CUCU|nr:NADH dehydrogenase subunit 6 [Chaetocnema tibialis]
MIFMLINSFLLILIKHPLTYGLILLIQTILTSLLTGMMMMNFWYSYILFLIMIGGMLILFIYMTSIASNEKFKTNMSMFTIIIIFMLLMMMILILDDYYNLKLKSIMTYKMNNFMWSFSKYFKFPSYFLMLLMMIYLFITLILAVKMTNLSYGPLRQKF